MGTHHFKYLIALGTDLNPELQAGCLASFVLLRYQIINPLLFKK